MSVSNTDELTWTKLNMKVSGNMKNKSFVIWVFIYAHFVRDTVILNWYWMSSWEIKEYQAALCAKFFTLVYKVHSFYIKLIFFFFFEIMAVVGSHNFIRLTNNNGT